MKYCQLETILVSEQFRLLFGCRSNSRYLIWIVVTDEEQYLLNLFVRKADFKLHDAKIWLARDPRVTLISEVSAEKVFLPKGN